LISLVTSDWVYSGPERNSAAPRYDKDFKRLNKLATKHKATTCIEQYKLRRELADSVRLKPVVEN